MTLSFAPEAIETWPLDRLGPYVANAKTHGKEQVAKIAASMAEFGWTVPVLVSNDGEPTNPFMGSLQASSVIDDYSSELIPDNDQGVLWGSPRNTWTGDLQPIEVNHGLPRHVPKWGLGFKHWIAENYLKFTRFYSQHSSLPSRRAYCDLDPVVRDQFGQSALRITHDWTDYDRRSVEYFMGVKRSIAKEMGVVDHWEDSPTPHYHVTVHDAGVHRMGDDPKTSVTSKFGEVHECRGLYAVGGGQFSTLAAYNPTETIMAMAYLTSDQILGRV